MNLSPISISTLRATFFRVIKGILKREEAVAITNKREIVAYLVHPETFNRAITDFSYRCPFCDEPVEISQSEFKERMSLKSQISKSACGYCGKDIYLIRDIRPHVFVSGDLPKGFEK